MKERIRDKYYCILGYNSEKDIYYGYVEHSFCMGNSTNRVRIKGSKKDWHDPDWRKYARKQYPNMDFIGYNQYLWFWLRDNAKKLTDRKYENAIWKVYRVNSKHCPVNIDMTEWRAMIRKKIKYNKFNYRNCKFIRK